MNTRIAAIDTASEFGSLALVADGVVVEEVMLHSPDGFAHIVFQQLQRLMARHGWRHDQISGYVAGAGPGSFTGVRVALAAVKGLAEAAGAKAAAVSNLRAVASFATAARRAAFFDARRGEIYGAVFDANLKEMEPELVASFPEWLAHLPPDVELISTDPAPFAAMTGGRLITTAPRLLAGAIGVLGAGALVDPIELDANYVRRSDAELKWTEN